MYMISVNDHVMTAWMLKPFYTPANKVEGGGILVCDGPRRWTVNFHNFCPHIILTRLV